MTIGGTPQEFTFNVELRLEQADAVRDLGREETGVLVAPPGAGKTVMACAAIAARATATLGSHRHTITPRNAGELPSGADDLPPPHPVLHIHPTGFRYTGDADPTAPGGMAEIYRALVVDEERLEQVVTDVLQAHRGGANVLVLTTWVDHLEAITRQLSNAGCEVTVLRGGMKARERQEITPQLATYSPDQPPLLVVGTSSFVGEGFDCPALDTLFLAAPITFKNRLVQYVGRVTRAFPGKMTATVHDYHDELTPVLESSPRKRAPGYTQLGFPDPRKQRA